jgi:hypothetical protein
MSNNTLNRFILGLLALSCSAIFSAVIPDIIGGKLECTAEMNIVAKILEMGPREANQYLAKVELYHDGQKQQKGNDPGFFAIVIPNPNNDVWGMQIFGPDYGLTTFFTNKTLNNSIIHNLPFDSGRKDSPIPCTFSWPEKELP